MVRSVSGGGDRIVRSASEGSGPASLAPGAQKRGLHRAVRFRGGDRIVRSAPGGPGPGVVCRPLHGAAAPRANGVQACRLQASGTAVVAAGRPRELGPLSVEPQAALATAWRGGPMRSCRPSCCLPLRRFAAVVMLLAHEHCALCTASCRHSWLVSVATCPLYPLGPDFKNPKWVQIGLYSNTGLGIQTGAGPTPARIEIIIHTAEMRD